MNGPETKFSSQFRVDFLINVHLPTHIHSLKHTQPNWKILPSRLKMSKIQVDILKGYS